MEVKAKNNNKNKDGTKKKTKKAKVRVFQKKRKGNSEEEVIKKLQEQYETVINEITKKLTKIEAILL